MPTSTDLVTDLPADFEVFGQAVATSMGDLLGGTTGQILSKATNTDMDFVWIANDQGDITGVTATSPLTGGGTSGAITVGIQDALTTQKGAVQLSDSTSTTSSILAATPTAVKSAYDLANAAIPKTLTTTTGDTIYASSANTPARLGIGSTGQVLTVASGIPSWATPATLSTTWTLLNAGGTALTGGGASTRTVSFSAQNSLFIYVTGASCTAAEQMQYNFNSDATSVYTEIGSRFNASGVQSSLGGTRGDLRFGETAAAAGALWSGMYVFGAKGTGVKTIILTGGGVTGAGVPTFAYSYNGLYAGTSAITSVNVISNSSAFDAGTVYVYGA